MGFTFLFLFLDIFEQIFIEKLDNEIRMAKREGSYDLGLLELNSDSGKITENVSPIKIADSTSGIEATLRSFEVDRGIEWEAAEKVHLLPCLLE